ncbi:hypothetical protein BH09PSE4_BH09PSE4_13650 [soil metagenome]
MIAGENGVWRIADWSLEAMVLTLELERLARSAVAVAASSGRVLGAPDALHGVTIVEAFELPALGDGVLASPRLMIAAAGAAPGWRRAALLVSTDGGARWDNAGATAAPAVIGTLTSQVEAGPAAIFDLANTIEVALANESMLLADADDAGLDRGANLALVGDELLQFGRAEPIGDCRWRLSRLLRGRRGTEAAIGTQGVGDRFVLIEQEALVAIDLPLASIGAEVRVAASGIGDLAGPAETVTPLSGVSVRPPSPVHLDARIRESGDVEISWVRRSRIGWRWIDGADAPLGEESELYRVSISGVGVARAAETAASTMTVTGEERVGGPLTVSVRQAGTNGDSPAAAITIPAMEE